MFELVGIFVSWINSLICVFTYCNLEAMLALYDVYEVIVNVLGLGSHVRVCNLEGNVYMTRISIFFLFFVAILWDRSFQ